MTGKLNGLKRQKEIMEKKLAVCKKKIEKESLLKTNKKHICKYFIAHHIKDPKMTFIVKDYNFDCKKHSFMCEFDTYIDAVQTKETLDKERKKKCTS